MPNNSFKFNYSVPTESERREIESIRRQYAKADENTETNKLLRLRKLHKGIVNKADACSLAVGIIGTLIFGGGMALAMEFSEVALGIIVSAVGLIPTLLAYPVYKIVLKSGKKKYGEEILRLSDELLCGKEDEK